MALHDRNPARIRFTSEGGLALRLINRTGSPSAKGKVVVLSDTHDNAVMTAPANSKFPIGVMYESGVGDGLSTWIVITGRAQVLLKDNVPGTRGYWLGVSDVAGRADCISDPPSTVVHEREIGHCMENRNPGGVNFLVYGILHYN